jgi:hypothetical protein
VTDEAALHGAVRSGNTERKNAANASDHLGLRIDSTVVRSFERRNAGTSDTSQHSHIEPPAITRSRPVIKDRGG